MRFSYLRWKRNLPQRMELVPTQHREEFELLQISSGNPCLESQKRMWDSTC